MNVLAYFRSLMGMGSKPVEKPATPFYRSMHIVLFDTCVLKCGYCHLAEQGNVLDNAPLQRYKDEKFIDQFADFFNSRTTASEKWNLLLTGGDPLLMPNMDRFCDRLFSQGNRVSLYTSLHFSLKHSGLKYLLSKSAPDFDYVMASLHPEDELDEDGFFERVALLKKAGHQVIVRYVGHPKRLGRLGELLARCQQLDVCFYPTTLFSGQYPSSYTQEERNQLRSYFSSYSQIAQLNDGLDSTRIKCHAGSKTLAVYMQTGEITPCILIKKPVLGNIYENRLDLLTKPIKCPEPTYACNCDVHYQQDIVIGSEDSQRFEAAKRGYVHPLPLVEQEQLVAEKGLPFYVKPLLTLRQIGQTTGDDVLIYDKKHVKDAYNKNFGGPDKKAS